MKNNKQCPKCNSADIIRVPGSVSAYGAGNNIPTGSSIFSSIAVTRYLCGQCGYTEEWIDSQEDVAKVRKKCG
jgi:ribosomal protein S27AE